MKKRLLITSALMTAVLGASLATGTYAWYTVTNAASLTHTAISADFTANDTQHALDGITVEFKLTPAATKTKLSNTDGKYKVWNKDGTVATEYEIEASELSGFYTTVQITVSKIYKTTDTTKTALTTEQLVPFAGTYSEFTVTTTGKLAGGDEAPSDVAGLNGLTIGDIDKFNLVISTAGVASVTDGEFAVAMRGDDTIKDGSETGSVSITYTAA